MNDLNEFPWATALMVTVAFVIVLVGGADVLFRDDLTFQEYLDALEKFAIGVGILSVGRGIRSGLKAHAVVSRR